jgi:cell division protein FtsI (penicillin-binding protein 3)
MNAAGGTSAALNWRRRLMQRLLYGQNVDRSVKSRARVGLAILVFSLGYAVIAGRLIQLAAAPDNHTVRRAADAVSTSRPDIVDRNGEILATDIKTASLFGEPRKIIDVD